jgi:hypothetical protein
MTPAAARCSRPLWNLHKGFSHRTTTTKRLSARRALAVGVLRHAGPAQVLGKVLRASFPALSQLS